MNNKNIIAICGQIGAGKTTACEFLKHELNAHVVEEIPQNQQKVFDSLLDLIYSGTKGAELYLQLAFMTNNFKESREVKNIDSELIVYDRCIFEHAYFAKMNLSCHDYMAFYKPMFITCLSILYGLDILPKTYYILDLPWSEAKKRILGRNRPQEIENFDKNEPYFKNLSEKYTAGVQDCIKEHVQDARIVVIDSSHRLFKEEIMNDIRLSKIIGA